MIRVELPYDIRLIPETALWLSHIAKEYGISEKRAYTLCFVVETALENRAYQPCDGPSVFVLTLDETSDSVSVSITDKGMPYVLNERYKEMLLNGLVSSFSFEQLGVDGQRLRFNVQKEPGAGTQPPVIETEKEELLDRNISCRLTQTDDEDILRAIRVIFSNYGFRYVHQEIYRHEHFRAALQSGNYVSIMAENALGQIVGHVALEEHDWFPGVPEVCNLVVKEFARGLKVSQLLVEAAQSEGMKKQFEGIYAMPVLRHPISQKLFNKQGYTPCGFYFHRSPSSTKGPENDDGNRADVAYCVSILNKDRLHSLYLPEECKDFVTGIFDSEGAAYEVLPEGESAEEETALSYRIDGVNKLLEVRVDCAGRDIAASIEAYDVPKALQMTDVVMVYLNMNDPGCPRAYRYFMEHGFIFTGCLPCSLTGDYLLLQHLQGQPIIRESMVLEPNYREMLDRL